MEKIEEFTLKQVIDNQERVIKEQKEDIERLQAQLDREIHANRKLVKALKEYANLKNWKLYFTLKNIMKKKFFFEFDNYKANELAQQTLKEIEEV